MKKLLISALLLAALGPFAAAQTVIEDFENASPTFSWKPLGQNAVLNGMFSVVDNPGLAAPNTSAKCGRYVKGFSPFSALAADTTGFFDLSQNPQFNLHILAPTGAKSATLQLFSVAQGSKEVTSPLAATGGWEALIFDFSAFQGISDWASLRLVFDGGTAANGAIYFFDNLSQSPSSVDPCLGAVPDLHIVDDFGCQRNYSYGAGNDKLSVAINPSIGGLNPSIKCGKYADPADDPYAALVVEMPGGVDLSTDFTRFEMLVKAPAAGLPVVFKLEGGTSPAVESPKYFSSGTGWAKIGHDFAAQAGGDFKRMAIFFNFGQNGASQNWHIDDLQWTRAGYNGCIATFDAPELSPADWGFFENGNVPPSEGFKIVDNPNPTGINQSQKVGKAVEAGLNNGGSQVWGGMYTDLDAPLRFSSSTKKIRMKVLMPALAAVTMKLENSATGAASSPDNTVTATKTGQWEELEWDFSSLPNNADYRRITLIWNIAAIPPTDQTYFFDDILMVGGKTDCQPLGTWPGEPMGLLEIWPNPVGDVLFVKNFEGTARFLALTALGQVTLDIPAPAIGEGEIDISRLPRGLFALVGLAADGRAVSRARFVKQ